MIDRLFSVNSSPPRQKRCKMGFFSFSETEIIKREYQLRLFDTIFNSRQIDQFCLRQLD